MVKITLIGDIMCEPLLMKAAKKQDGTYDFSGVFCHVTELLDNSDYVIANLEAPLAGEQAGYTRELFSFNAPDALADAIKNAGISFVSTANNHCMDRGIDGLLRTIQVLDEKEIPHFGTFLHMEDRQEAYYFQLNDLKVALITGTYGINFALHHRGMTPDQEGQIALFRPHTEFVYLKSNMLKKQKYPVRILKSLLKGVDPETKDKIKKQLGLPYNHPRRDDALDEKTVEPYFATLREAIELAKKRADLVLFYPHVGGQFNITPGRFTEYTVSFALQCGVDAVIGSHPHIVQCAKNFDGRPCFYSIGNFSMSPNSWYLLHEHLPEYGLAVHLYVKEKRIVRVTFSVLKMVEPKGQMLTVYPVDELGEKLGAGSELKQLKRDVAQICATVLGNELEGEILRREYPFWQK